MMPYSFTKITIKLKLQTQSSGSLTQCDRCLLRKEFNNIVVIFVLEVFLPAGLQAGHATYSSPKSRNLFTPVFKELRNHTYFRKRA